MPPVSAAVVESDDNAGRERGWGGLVRTMDGAKGKRSVNLAEYVLWPGYSVRPTRRRDSDAVSLCTGGGRWAGEASKSWGKEAKPR